MSSSLNTASMYGPHERFYAEPKPETPCECERIESLLEAAHDRETETEEAFNDLFPGLLDMAGSPAEALRWIKHDMVFNR